MILDGANNWDLMTLKPDGGKPVILDHQMNTLESYTSFGGMAYDSRDNLTLLTDAQSPPGAETEFTTALVTLNLPGNRTEQRYDGINRLRKTLRTLTADGQGNGMPVGTITTQQGFDGNSRLTSQTDDRGKVTTYEYDALNRKNKEIYADTRFVEMAFDRDDNVRTLTDPNGSVRTGTYDAVNRLVDCSVARGPDVVGTTLQAFQYDGLRQVKRGAGK